MTHSNDNKKSNLGEPFDRHLSHTQLLLKEAEAVLQRLAKNRAAMTRPQAPAPTAIERRPEPAPEQTDPADWPLRRRKSRELTAEESQVFSALFARRGYIVNADVRSATGLTMAQASLRLQTLSSADVVRRQGMGSLSRYYPGDRWRPSPHKPAAEIARDPTDIHVSVGTPSDALPLADFAQLQVQALACDASAELSLRDATEKKAFYLKHLRSHRGVMLLAREGSGALAGYARCGFDHKRHQGGVGFIWALVCAVEAHENTRLRLMEAATKWLFRQGATSVRVQVPHGNAAALELFVDRSFRPTSLQLELATIPT